MTVMLCQCSRSRSSSTAVVMRPVSGVIRNRASGSDWGSMENLKERKQGEKGNILMLIEERRVKLGDVREKCRSEAKRKEGRKQAEMAVGCGVKEAERASV